MKNAFRKIALVAVVLLPGAWCKAQQVPGQNLAGPVPLNGQLTPPQVANPGALTQLTTEKGIITEYTTNDRYEYDGFTLRESGKSIVVKFPAHLGAQLMKTAPKGQEVTVSGTYNQTPDGNVFQFYSLKDGNNLITDTPPPVEQNTPAEQIKNFSGIISDLNRDPNGMVSGVVLDGKTFISIPPPAAGQLTAYLKAGGQVSGTGLQRHIPNGVVLAKNMSLTDARTITVNGQTYLIR